MSVALALSGSPYLRLPRHRRNHPHRLDWGRRRIPLQEEGRESRGDGTRGEAEEMGWGLGEGGAPSGHAVEEEETLGGEGTAAIEGLAGLRQGRMCGRRRGPCS